MQLTRKLIFLLLAGLFFVQCSDKNLTEEILDEELQKTLKNPVKLKIEDAQALAILEYQEGQARVDSHDRNNLYLKTSSDDFQPVVLLDEDGNEIEPDEFQIENIIDFHEDYLLLIGDMAWNVDTPDNEIWTTHLLVHKTNGTFYDLESAGLPYLQNDGDDYFLPNTFKWDNNDRVYYSFFGLSRLDISDPAALTYEQILPASQERSFFEVDSEGNVFYSYNGKLKAKTTQGNVVLTDHWRIIWSNHENKIFTMVMHEDEEGRTFDLAKVSLEDGQIILTPIGDIDIPENAYLPWESSLTIKTSNHTVLIDDYDGSNIWVHDSEVNTLTHVDIQMSGELIQTSTHGFYYLSDQSLSKLNIPDLSVEEITLPISEYEFQNVRVSHSGTIQFSAFRYSDGKDVYGTIEHDGNISIEGESEFIVTLFYPMN